MSTTIRVKPTILVVDDNEDALSGVVAMLKEADSFILVSASSGAGAIEASRKHQGEIDVLVTDVNMPGMSGPALAELLQSNRPNLRVLLMSGAYVGIQSRRNEAWGVIQKPFVTATLLEAVKKLTDTHVLSSIAAG